MLQRAQKYGQIVQSDPIRVIEAIVSAIGFLGAGTIFVAHRNSHVAGLTTAASIWATAAIGITVGLDRFPLAVGTAAVTLFILRGLPLLGIDPDPDPREDSSSTKPPGRDEL
ncbi:MAG: MgtC/SapB family protein [Chloroflexi bacterium]|nr:MgtC/SapB family protein [Chloroflexota bacterium]